MINMIKSPEKPLLILDLDETVIFSQHAQLPDVPVVTRSGGYFVHQRPHLPEFLAQVSQWYTLAIWTAASMDYAQDIAKNAFEGYELAFIWAYERCVLRRNFEIDAWVATKPLVKVKRSLGVSLSQMLILEDDPLKVQGNYGNAVYVEPFQGNPHDDDLLHLPAYLEELSGETNMRHIEKRGWKQRKP